MRRATGAGLAAAIAAAALGGGLTAAMSADPAPAAKKRPKPRTVEVFDNFYSPARLTVRPDTKVTWKWPADVGDSHDVKARKVPRGARKFASPPYAAEAKWSQTFRKPGTYRLYCTFHETEMTMTVVVRKK
jgi:plastocyanin